MKEQEQSDMAGAAKGGNTSAKESTEAQALPGIDLDQLTRYEPTDGSEGPFMYANPSGEWLMRAEVIALIAQARAARPKREMPPEMKAAIEGAHKTGATSALLPNGSAVFINYGHDYGDNDHLCCTACGGSGHIEDQQARSAAPAGQADEQENVAAAAGQHDASDDLMALLKEHGYPDDYPGYVDWGTLAEQLIAWRTNHALNVLDAAPVSPAGQQAPNFDKLHSDIMNLPCDASPYDHARSERIAYKYGHRDARHAAAELVNAFAAQCEGAAQAAVPAAATDERALFERVWLDEQESVVPAQISAAWSAWKAARATLAPVVAQQADELKQLRNRVSQLEAARIGYASEFPLTADGEPDVGNIHANIRALKSEFAAQQAAAKAPAAQAVPGDWTVEWESVSSPTMIRLNSPTWGGCFLPKPPPGDIALASIFYYLLADMLAATPASTPDASQQGDATSSEDARDAARWRFSMQFQGDGSSKEQPRAIIDMWRKVYAEGRLRPTREEYEAATDAAMRATQQEGE